VVTAVVGAVVDGTVINGIIIYVLSLLGGSALGSLLGTTKSINLAMHMMIVEIVRPSLVDVVVGKFIELFTFDILPVE
jgi:hypothetical protein